jgi:hypothetical protein
VLGASTLEEGEWMDESQLEEPRTEEADIKTKKTAEVTCRRQTP